MKRREQLLNHLKKLKEQRSKWERAKLFTGIKVAGLGEYNNIRCEYYVEHSYINFEDIKLLVIAKISKKIEQLQKEFDAL